MATPLGELLRRLRTDTEMQQRFTSSPGDYLHEHGWGDLDAADVQEAILLLADAAPTPEAVTWITAADTIDPDGHDPAAALGDAFRAIEAVPVDEPDDPAALDDIDDIDDIDEIDEIDEHADPDDLDAFDDEANDAAAADIDDHPEPARGPTGPIDAESFATSEPFDEASTEPFDEPTTEPFDEPTTEPFDEPPTGPTEVFAEPAVDLPSDLDLDPEPDPDWDDPN